MPPDQSVPYVFPNQIKAWAELEAAIAGQHQARALLKAQPQVGKTSFMVHGAVQRAKRAKELGLSYFNVIAISDSNNALKDQTQLDLYKALRSEGLMKESFKFEVIHRANLDNVPVPEHCKMLTVFTDEAHIAARCGGGRDRFQRRIYDYQGDRLLVDVGATSFAHIALHEQLDSPYDAVINLEPGPAYNSVEFMYEQGRIRQVEKLCDKFGTPTSFLAERLEVLKRHGGYTLIRAIGKRHIAVIKAIRSLAPTMNIVEADMFKTAVVGKHITISEIPTFLSKQPEQPTVLLVRGALRVGIVLKPECSKNICEMIDTNAVRADTVTQSFVGRSCGYHKRGDTYGIFTNLKDVETVIDFYNDVYQAIPVGLKNTGAKKTGTYQIVPYKDAQVMIQNHKLVSRCSLNNENDCADIVLRNVNTWDNRLVLIDKANPNFTKSWALLMANRPEVIGNYVSYNSAITGYNGAEVLENFIDLGYTQSNDEDEISEDEEI